MARLIEGKDRRQTLLLPECLDDYVTQDNPVRVIDAFIDELDLQALGFPPSPACRHRTTCLPSGRSAQDLPLRLPAPGALQPSPLSARPVAISS
jgi:hypothetical protein